MNRHSFARQSLKLGVLLSLAACQTQSIDNTNTSNSSGNTGFVDGGAQDAGPPDAAPPPTVAELAPEELPNPPALVTPDAAFRTNAPPAGPTTPFVAPRVERMTLPNGMTVLLVRQPQLPIVYAQLVSRRGADDVPTAQSGVAWMTAALLEQGTTTLSAEALSDAYAAIAAQHGSNVDWDSAEVSVRVLPSNVPRAMELLADQVQHPAFAPEEIERLRTRRLAAIRAEKDSPRSVAAIVGARVLYGNDHPYSRPVNGVEGSVRSLTREQVVNYYRAHYVPNDCALVVTGAITMGELRPLAVRLFGSWRQEAATPAVARQAAVPAPPSQQAGVYLVDRARAPQSSVVLAMHGTTRADRNYPRLRVMNAILGGIFSSRINLNLREQHGYTYGARSSFALRRGVGPFTAGGAIITAHTADAVREILSEIERMRSTNVSSAELTTAQTAIIEGFRAQFATTEATADAVSEVFVHRLPADEFVRLPRDIQRVRIADVRAIATSRITPARLNVVVVGDRATVAPMLEGLSRGAVTLLDNEGAPANAANAAAPTTVPTTATP